MICRSCTVTKEEEKKKERKKQEKNKTKQCLPFKAVWSEEVEWEQHTVLLTLERERHDGSLKKKGKKNKDGWNGKVSGAVRHEAGVSDGGGG